MLISVDIVLPCYNPSDKWYLELLDFYNCAKNLYNLNFILVNDGSYDVKVTEQVELLKTNGVSIHYLSYPKNRGKGYALRYGVNAATNEYVAYTDIDFPFTNKSTLDLIKNLTENQHDVVAGYRNQDYYQKNMTWFRKILSKAFRFFITNVLGLNITDTQCGLKGFNKKGKAKFLATKINRYLFDFEFIYLSCKDKTISVSTVPVQLKDNVVFSKMRFKILFQEMLNLFYVLVFRKN